MNRIDFETQLQALVAEMNVLAQRRESGEDVQALWDENLRQQILLRETFSREGVD